MDLRTVVVLLFSSPRLGTCVIVAFLFRVERMADSPRRAGLPKLNPNFSVRYHPRSFIPIIGISLKPVWNSVRLRAKHDIQKANPTLSSASAPSLPRLR